MGWVALFFLMALLARLFVQQFLLCVGIVFLEITEHPPSHKIKIIIIIMVVKYMFFIVDQVIE